MMVRRKIPTLVELCIQTAIDNVKYLGDIGETDIDLLKDVLPHCNAEQLMHIEKSSEGRDLSPITDSLWKKFYEKQFGDKSAKVVIERMSQKKVTFKWKKLYEAKLKDMNEVQKKSVNRLKELYENETSRKQSRQIKVVDKVPPSSSNKRSWGGSGSFNGFSSSKNNLMKKSKMEFLNSREVKNNAAIRKSSIQRTQSVPSTMRPAGDFRGNASSSGFTKPMEKRF